MIFLSVNHIAYKTIPGDPRWRSLQRKCTRCERSYIVGPAFDANACPYCKELFMDQTRWRAALACLQMPDGDRLLLAVFSEEP